MYLSKCPKWRFLTILTIFLGHFVFGITPINSPTHSVTQTQIPAPSNSLKILIKNNLPHNLRLNPSSPPPDPPSTNGGVGFDWLSEPTDIDSGSTGLFELDMSVLQNNNEGKDVLDDITGVVDYQYTDNRGPSASMSPLKAFSVQYKISNSSPNRAEQNIYYYVTMGDDIYITSGLKEWTLENDGVRGGYLQIVVDVRTPELYESAPALINDLLIIEYLVGFQGHFELPNVDSDSKYEYFTEARVTDREERLYRVIYAVDVDKYGTFSYTVPVQLHYPSAKIHELTFSFDPRRANCWVSWEEDETFDNAFVVDQSSTDCGRKSPEGRYSPKIRIDHMLRPMEIDVMMDYGTIDSSLLAPPSYSIGSIRHVLDTANTWTYSTPRFISESLTDDEEDALFATVATEDKGSIGLLSISFSGPIDRGSLITTFDFDLGTTTTNNVVQLTIYINYGLSIGRGMCQISVKASPEAVRGGYKPVIQVVDSRAASTYMGEYCIFSVIWVEIESEIQSVYGQGPVGTSSEMFGSGYDYTLPVVYEGMEKGPASPVHVIGCHKSFQ